MWQVVWRVREDIGIFSGLTAHTGAWWTTPTKQWRQTATVGRPIDSKWNWCFKIQTTAHDVVLPSQTIGRSFTWHSGRSIEYPGSACGRRQEEAHLVFTLVISSRKLTSIMYLTSQHLSHYRVSNHPICLQMEIIHVERRRFDQFEALRLATLVNINMQWRLSIAITRGSITKHSLIDY